MASGIAKPLFVKKNFTYSGSSLGQTSSRTITQTNFGYSAPSGYWYLGLLDYYSGANNMTLRAVDPAATNMMMVFNYGASASHTAKENLLFVLANHRESSAS